MIKNIKEIAIRNNETDILNNIELVSKENKNLRIVFMGQFSVGKSSVISNLLNIDFLPIFASESTAKITIISYGEKDRALKILDSGEEIEISLDELKNTSLENKNQLTNISFLKVFVNNEKLIGVDIIDTPGIAGLNESARTLAYDFLPNVDVAVYLVFPRGFSEEDKRFFNFSKNQIKHIIPVINQVDNMSNDNISETLNEYQKQWETLFEIEKNHDMYFYSCKDFDYTSKGIEKFDLSKYLFQDLKDNSKRIMEESKDKKLNTISLILKNKLINKKIIIEKSFDDKDLNNKLDSLKLDLIKLKFEINDNKSQIQVKLKNTNDSYIINNLSRKLDDFYKNFSDKIENKNINEIQKNFKEEIEVSSKELIDSSYEEWQNTIQKQVNSILDDNQKTFQKDIKNLFYEKLNFNPNVDISFIEKNQIDIKSLSEKIEKEKLDIQKNKILLEEKIKFNQQELEEFNSNKEFIESEYNEMNKDISEVLFELSNIKNLKPEYIEIIEEGKGQLGEKIGRGIGNLADWALIFVPGGQVKLLTPLTKVAKSVGASKLVLDKLSKATKTLNKINKTISGTNTIAGKVIKTLGGKTENMKMLDTVLDNLSLEGWGGKLGKVIGNAISPPTISRQIDPEWELNQKQEIELRQINLLKLQKEYSDKIDAKYDIKLQTIRLSSEIELLKSDLYEYQEMIQDKEFETKQLTNKKNLLDDNNRIYLINSVRKIESEIKRDFNLFSTNAINNIIENLHNLICNDMENVKNTLSLELEKTKNIINSNKNYILKEKELLEKEISLL